MSSSGTDGPNLHVEQHHLETGATGVYVERNFGNLTIHGDKPQRPKAARRDLHSGDLGLSAGTGRLGRNAAASRLLVARYAVVPFAHRIELLDEMDAWVEKDVPVSLRLITGVGGMGKTRLAQAWTARWRERGWQAGFAAGALAPERAAELAAASRAVVVIDYAETREGLGELLRHAAMHFTDPRGEQAQQLRVLLLARNAGDWWAGLRDLGPEVRDLLDDATEHELAPVVVGEAAREGEFFRAAAAFAERLNREAPKTAPPLEDPRFERTLYLHMAGLASVLGLSMAAGNLVNELLDHEAAFWLMRAEMEGADTVDRDTFKAEVRQGLAAVTLWGGVERKDAADTLLSEVAPTWSTKVGQVLRGVHPGEGWLGALEPDLLGEGLVVRVLSDSMTPSGFLDRVLQGADEAALVQAFTVLGRVELEHPEEGRRWLAEVLEVDLGGRVVAALEAAKAVGARRADPGIGRVLAAVLERAGTDAIAVALEPGLPHPEHTVSLREVGAWVLGRLARLPAEEEVQAGRKNNLSVWLSSLGRREEALSATLEAVDLFRRLTRAHPDAFNHDLAGSLNNLGIKLSELGHREEALAAAQEAVDLYRRLARARPDAFNPDLARSLNNLSNQLAELGRREEALSAMQDAVDLKRPLARARPDAFNPDLAMSLTGLGVLLSSLGRRDEALSVTQEAVNLYRRLAATRPDAFNPDLAGSLNNLGSRLSELGRRDQALSAVQEAVDLHRRLALSRPDAFNPDLAGSLNNLGSRLSALGRRDQALSATKEAVDLRRRLACARPDAFNPDLARSLNNLGSRLSELGRREEALAATQEAVNLRRDLACARPGAFNADLAGSLNNLGNRLSELGRQDQALSATQEAVDLYRRLACARPDAFNSNVATSLNNLGSRLSELGRQDEALAATQEAVDLCRRLACARPDAFNSDLATSLDNLGSDLSSLGRREEALAATQEAVDLRRRLARARPDAFNPDLATSLNNLGIRLSVLGRRDEALSATQEAVDLYRRLARARPDAFNPDLARSLGALGSVQRLGGDTSGAAVSFQEGIECIWPLFERVPAVFAGLTGALLQAYGSVIDPNHPPPWLVEKRQRLQALTQAED
ncbi:MAG: tetratricopeptide repeat protein [Alphaproteobacteria bacterium]|nr:tetratricopeptide repeat protein [Alphaproteobacteria bacterium]